MSADLAPAHDLVVLAGGGARRLGGVDKAELVVGGARLLDLVLAAAPRAGRRVVVGPARHTAVEVTWCREDPPGGGPVAALAAGWAAAAAPWLVVLAVDQPFVDPDVVDRLLGAADGRDGAIGVDPRGRDQVLTAVYRRAALGRALEALDGAAGTAMRTLIGRLDLARVPLGDAATDCDTWFDVEAARRRAGG